MRTSWKSLEMCKSVSGDETNNCPPPTPCWRTAGINGGGFLRCYLLDEMANMVLVEDQEKWAWVNQCVVTQVESKQNDGHYPGPPEVP